MNRRDALKTFAAVAAGGTMPAAGAVVASKMSSQAAYAAMISANPATRWKVKFDGEDGWREVLQIRPDGFIFGPCDSIYKSHP